MSKKCSNSGDCYPGDYCENGNCCGPNAGNDCSGGILTNTIQNNRRNRVNRKRNLRFTGYSNASGFMGTGISTLKVIWWGIGSLVVLAVVAKGLRVYRSAKYY